jgi:hypothetical protein
MTAEMLTKSRETAEQLGLAQVEFRDGLAEAMPVDAEWAERAEVALPLDEHYRGRDGRECGALEAR